MIIDSNENILGQYETVSSNPNSVGDEKAKSVLIECINKTLEESKRKIENGKKKKKKFFGKKINGKKITVKAICLALAGVDRPKDIEKVYNWISEAFPNKKIFIFNDAFAALASGTKGDLNGVVIISGTGSICYGIWNGKKARSSGFGPLFFDVNFFFFLLKYRINI